MSRVSAVDRAAWALQTGGVVAYPTESVFGLGCDPLEATAVARILAIKRRSVESGLILLAADVAQLEAFIRPAPAERERMLASWPGPVTWVVAATPAAPAWVTGGRDTIAVRVTAEPLAAALCRRAGMAIVSTSANRSSRPPARNTLQTRRRFAAVVDQILPGAVGGHARPTEIRLASSGRILRAG
ncbi:MAG: Sua5/YciO/YrdC/YwlC family protein [Gammaproteobacteria bacterium]|jgi:L-threonylcarbamoyladenylate synthase